MMDYKIILEILLTFVKIDILSFGGGYVAIPIVERQIVEIKGWMSYSEFMDILAIDELTPGPIAINCATFIGNKMYGILGGILATLANIIPSIIISLIIIKIYTKYKNAKIFKGIISGLKCMVVGLLAHTVLTLIINSIYPNNNINITSILLIAISIFVLRKYKINPILVILGSGTLNLLLYLI